MYTIQKYTDTINTPALLRVVTVMFIDDTSNVITKVFKYPVGTPDDRIKREVKQFLTELNTPFTPISGDIVSVTDPTPGPLKADQIAENEWRTDRARLAYLMELVRDGVFTGTETQIVNLRNKVKANFKTTYI